MAAFMYFHAVTTARQSIRTISYTQTTRKCARACSMHHPRVQYEQAAPQAYAVGLQENLKTRTVSEKFLSIPQFYHKGRFEFRRLSRS